MGNDSEDSEIDFKETKAQIVAWYKKVSQKRFKHLPNGYHMDRWMFQTAMFLTFAFLFFVAHSYNYNLDFYRCGPEPGTPEYLQPGPDYTCPNPFYKPDMAWKGQENLPPGEYGTKLGPLFNSAFYSPFLIFGLAFGINHLIHNQRRRTQ